MQLPCQQHASGVQLPTLLPQTLLGLRPPGEGAPAQAARASEVGLTRPDAVCALKRIAAAAHAVGKQGIMGQESVQLAVASAVLMLPESEFMVRVCTHMELCVCVCVCVCERGGAVCACVCVCV